MSDVRPPEPVPDSAPGMRKKVLNGLAWTGGSQIVMQLMRPIVAVVLARMLSPEGYGVAALALVFSSLVLVFSDLALGAAVVQRKNLSEDDRCTAFWMSVGAGVLFTVLGLALAPAVAAFYGEPEVGPLCSVLSLTFLITSLGATQESLLVRDMRFSKLEQRTMFATVVAAVTALAFALWLRSAWAIIAQEIAYAVTSTLLLWSASSWRPKLRASRESLRALGSFSIYLVGHRLLFYAHRNADNVLVGRYLGAAALGAYTLAYNIMLVPFSRLGGPIQRVLGPALSRMQDEPKRIGEAWVRVVRLLAAIAVPALAGLVVVAPDFIHVVLGDDWDAAIPLIQILAWVGLLQALQTPSVDILQARGRTRTMFRFSIVFATTHIVAFAIGLHWGLIGIAVAYAVSNTILEPAMLWLTARSIDFSPWRVIGATRGAFEATLLMVVVVFAARQLMLDAVPAGVRLLVLIALGALVYVPASAWRASQTWRDVHDLIGDRLLGAVAARVPAGPRRLLRRALAPVL